MYPAATPSTYTILPQLPHCSRTVETQDSFSSAGSPTSSALAWLTGSSSQKMQRLHLDGRSSRLSSVILARRRDTGHLCHSNLHGTDAGKRNVLATSLNVPDVQSGSDIVPMSAR